MMRKILISLLAMLPLMLNAQGLLDGFYKGKGNFTGALSFSYETSTTYWAGLQEIDFGRNMPSASLFGTAGILDGLDAVVSLPLVNFQPQDASVFFKGRLFDAGLGSAFRLSLGLAAGGSFPVTSYNTESSLAIGQQARTLEGRGILQLMHQSGIFLQAQGGKTYAFSPVPSSLPASVKLGIAKAAWYADVWFDFREAIGGKDYRGTGELFPNSFRELGVSYKRIGGTFYKPLGEHSGISVGAAYTLSGRNTFQAAIFSVGYIWNGAF